MDLVFNKTEREAYLTGFHKRKEERKKQARIEIAQKLKEEKAIVRQKKLEFARKHQTEVHTSWGGDAADEAVCRDVDKQTLDLPHHSVSIIQSEIFDPSFNLYMGENKGDDSDEEKSDQPDDAGSNDEDGEDKKIYIKKSFKQVAKLARTKQQLETTRKHRASKTSKKVSKNTRKYLQKKQKAKRMAKGKPKKK